MFNINSTSIVQMSFKKAALQSEIKRKKFSRKLIDSYNDEQAQFVLEELQRIYSGKQTANMLLPVSINVLRKVVNRLASVYIQDASRSIDGTEQDKAAYASFEDVAALPVKMKQCNRLTKLCGNTLLRVVWRNGKPDLDILTPDLFDVVCGDSPENLEAVTITLFNDSGKDIETRYVCWTPESVTTLDYRGFAMSTEENPYQCLPFVPCFASSPTDSFWLPGQRSLLSVQEAVNLRISDLCYVLHFQSFGVGYVSGGKGSSTPMELGPGSYLHLPADAKLGFAAPQAPVEETLKAIDFLIKQAAVSCGLSAASMSLTPTSESGVAKIVSNAELEEQRRDDIALFARYEDQLFQLFRTVWNTHNPLHKLSDIASLTVDFHDPKPAATPTEQVKEWQAFMEAGLISPVDVMIARNPDLTRDMAKAKLLEIRDDLQEFQQISFAHPA